MATSSCLHQNISIFLHWVSPRRKNEGSPGQSGREQRVDRHSIMLEHSSREIQVFWIPFIAGNEFVMVILGISLWALAERVGVPATAFVWDSGVKVVDQAR